MLPRIPMPQVGGMMGQPQQPMPVDYSGTDIINGLVQRNIPQAAAIGFAGNAFAESGYNPGINEIAPLVEGSRGGFGLFQWTGPRRRQFEAFARERGAPLDDFETQLDFLAWELDNTETRARDAIYAAQTPEEAARLVSETFLRPGIPHLDRRIAEANRLAGGGGLLSGGGGSDTVAGGAGGDRMAGLLAPQERRPSIWDRLEGVPILGGLTDPDRRARLAVGLGGMSLNPNAMLMASNMQGIDQRARERETAQRLNQTIAYLESIGRGDLAALAAIDPGAALGQAQGPSELEQAQLERIRLETEMMRNGGTNVPADVASLQWRAQQMGLVEGTPEYTAFIASNGELPATTSTLEPEAVTELRKTWEALPAVRAFQVQSAGFSRLDAAAAQGNSTGDMALIFSFMKLLDPASTVREGEAAQASQAPGVQNSIISEYNRVINGAVLTPERRAEILATARATYAAAEQGYQQLYDQYASLASRQGFDPTTTLTDYRYTAQPVAPDAPPSSFNPTAAPATAPGPNNVPSPADQSAPPRFTSNQTIQMKAQELGITVDQMWAYVPEDQRAQWLN